MKKLLAAMLLVSNVALADNGANGSTPGTPDIPEVEAQNCLEEGISAHAEGPGVQVPVVGEATDLAVEVSSAALASVATCIFGNNGIPASFFGWLADQGVTVEYPGTDPRAGSDR